MTTNRPATKRGFAATAIGGQAQLICVLALLFAGLSAGCQKHGLETEKVHGTVTLDGAPVQKGTVMFVPNAGRAGHGVIQPDGTFDVTTYSEGDGAVVGEHKISIFVAFDENTTPEEAAKNRLPLKYATTASSGLTWNVKSGQTNEVPLDLKSK